MEKEQILEKLKEIVRPYVEDQTLFETVTEETDLIEDLKINSSHIVDIILDAEDTFDIEIDDVSAEKMITVKGAVEVVAQMISK